MKDYSIRQSKHYEGHKNEEEHAELWLEIRAFWNECINGTQDLSSKAIIGRVMACRDTFAQSVSLFFHCDYPFLHYWAGCNLVQCRGHPGLWMRHIHWKR